MEDKLKAYFYFGLNTVSVISVFSGSYALTVFFYRLTDNALLAVLPNILDILLIIMGVKYIAPKIDLIRSISMRIKCSAISQITICVISIFTVLAVNIENFVVVFLFFVLIKLIGLIDLFSKIIIPISLSNQKIVPLVRSLSINNLATRGGHMVAPIIGLAIVTLPNTEINPLSIYIASSVFSIASIFIISKTSIINHVIEKAKNKNHVTLIKWNITYLFLMNLSFGSMAYILSLAMFDLSSASFFKSILSGPSTIYFGFIVASIIIIILPSILDDFTTFKSASVVLLILSIIYVIASMLPDYSWIILFVFGIMFCVAVTSISNIFQNLVPKNLLVKAQSKSSLAGSIGLLISLICASFLMDFTNDVYVVMMIFGTIGIFFAVFLYFYASWVPPKNNKEKLLSIYLNE